LKVKIEKDHIVEKVCENYTYEFQEYIEFQKHKLDINLLPQGYNIGLIVGSSGSGKSLLLNDISKLNLSEIIWDNNKAVCSHFNSYESAEERLMGAGLNSIPSWLKPYRTLSNGQQYRCNLARLIGDNVGIDEFTSVIDRGTALGLSNSIQRLIRSKDYKNVIFASVHKDIIPYLQPDWIYNTDDKTLTMNSEIWDLECMEKMEFKKKIPFMESDF
jgi:ABC-type transport system involved in cytochrome bd biosynthesis fused ATPase/permease subunit